MLTRELTLLALKGEVFDPQPFVDALAAKDAAIATLKMQLAEAEHRAGYDGEFAQEMLMRGLQLARANERIAALERVNSTLSKIHNLADVSQLTDQLTKAEAALREINEMWEGWKRDPDDRDLRRWIHDWIERHRDLLAKLKATV